MKKLPLLITTLTILSTTSVFALTPFNTIAQAEQNCPAATDLTFTPISPTTPNSKGTVKGTHSNVIFNNLSGYVMHPKYLDSNNNIQNVQWRETNNMYGYISGNASTCFYSYPGFTNINVALVMQGYQ